MKKITTFMLMTICCGTLLLSGCKENEVTKPQKTGEAPFYEAYLKEINPAAYGDVTGLELKEGSEITLIGKNNTSYFWKNVKMGATEAVKDLNKNLGLKGKKAVKLNFYGMVDCKDVEEQVNILDEEMARYPEALGISLVDEKACLTQFDLAAENDLPVIALESGAEYPGIVATIHTNNLEAGRTAGRCLAEEISGKGKILMFMEDGLSLSTLNKEKGIKEVIESYYPEISIVDIFHPTDLNKRNQERSSEEEELDSDLSETEMIKKIVDDNPDALGIITSGESMTKRVLGVLKNTDDSKKVVSFGWNKNIKKAIKDEKISSCIVENPFGMGYATVIASVRAANKSPNEAVIDTGFVVVNKNNINKKEIKEKLYKLK